MTDKPEPTVTVVIAAYQAERWIAEALESILSQTRLPDEIIVVDDGSTDGTARELARFADRIRVVRRANGGCPAAFNTAFKEASGDFVAMCGADDIWEPQKLEWQIEAIKAHPEADLFSGHAMLVGSVNREHNRPPGEGLLDSTAFRNTLFIENCICAPSIVIRRSLFERLGPFIENFGADDYEYWFRCLRAGAQFYYDPRPMVRWRHHGGNLSERIAWMDECADRVRRMYKDDVEDPAVVRDAFSLAAFRIARRNVNEGSLVEARKMFGEVLRYTRGKPTPMSLRALLWIAVLGLPAGFRERAGSALIGFGNAAKALRGERHPAVP
jgi:glycosyltransferase involved in cell wall biosynthesis